MVTFKKAHISLNWSFRYTIVIHSIWYPIVSHYILYPMISKKTYGIPYMVIFPFPYMVIYPMVIYL